MWPSMVRAFCLLVRTDAPEGADPVLLSLAPQREDGAEGGMEAAAFTVAGLALAAAGAAGALTGVPAGCRAVEVQGGRVMGMADAKEAALKVVLVADGAPRAEAVAGLARFVADAARAACGPERTWTARLPEVRQALQGAVGWAERALKHNTRNPLALALPTAAVPLARVADADRDHAADHLAKLADALPPRSEAVIFHGAALLASAAPAPAATVALAFGFCAALDLLAGDGGAEREGIRRAHASDGTARIACYASRGGDVLVALLDDAEACSGATLSLVWAALGAARERRFSQPKIAASAPPARAWRNAETGTLDVRASSDANRAMLHAAYARTLRPLLVRCLRCFGEVRGDAPTVGNVLTALSARQRRLRLPPANPLAVLNTTLAEDAGLAPKVPGTRGAAQDALRTHLADGLAAVWHARPTGGASKLGTARMVTAVLRADDGTPMRAVARIDADGTEFYMLLPERGDADWETEVAGQVSQMRVEMGASLKLS